MRMSEAATLKPGKLEDAIKKVLLELRPGHSVRFMSSNVEISDLNPVGQKFRIVFEVQVTPQDKKEEPE